MTAETASDTAPPGRPGTPAPAADGHTLLPTASGYRTRTVIRELLAPRRGAAVAALGVLTAATAVGLLTAPLLGRIVDLVLDRGAVSTLVWLVGALAVVAVVRGLATAAGVSLVARVGEGALADLRERFVDRALRQPLERVERAGSGDLTARVSADVAVVARALREAMPELGRSVLTIVLTFGALAVLDWRFLLAALLAVPIQAWIVRWYLRRAIPLYARQRVVAGAQQQQLLESVGGARTVRAFRLSDDHVTRVTRASRAAVDLMLGGVRLATGFFGRLNIAEYVGLSAVLGTGYVLVGQGSVSVGVATAAALYFHSLFNPINAALALIDDAQVATASLARLVGVCDLPVPPEDEDPAERTDTPGVRLAGVGHTYVEGHLVLHDVDMEIAPGERVALVGASGAGKTTVAKLVAGIHDPSVGRVALGGVGLDRLSPAAVRATVALVSQEVHVFSGSLADDLRLARPESSDDDLRAALDRVGATGWVQALPDGLATVVGLGAHTLTTTQAQQLALARVVLADRPVVILDEATAEAGSAGARELEAASRAATEGRTAMVVAHRLTQAAAADRVVVMDRGRVVESGTHADLVAGGGRYAQLWAAWNHARV